VSDLLVLVLRPLAALGFFFTLVPVMIWFERKGSAFIQDRVGPNRAYIPGIGLRLAGFVHNFSDVVKLLTKEDFIPSFAHKIFYVLAPMLVMGSALLTYAVIPFGDDFTVGATSFSLRAVDTELGILWVFAFSSLAVYGVVLAGWASGSKYPLLGGIRGSAQMVSYEVSLGLAVIGAVIVFGTVDLLEMGRQQGKLLFGFLPMWGVVVQPLGCFLYLFAAFAETNRAPFDLVEGESEIVGFHTEYSGMKFALFFMGEYVAMAVQAAVVVTIFFGGWQIPWLDTGALLANAHTVLLVGLGAAVVLASLAGILLLRFHSWNKLRWQDERRREGAILAVVLGLVPALLAAVLFLVVWGTELTGVWPPTVAALAQVVCFAIKVLFFCWVFIWVRWTLPRFRYDQVMFLGWKVMLPLALLNVVVTAAIRLLVIA
jgi:NADH-quinone oxidoreductase subunit H